ncbi:hypothetical protein EDD86DRAFT_211496 [Gorgonomyces haynaldii]|nr:hypothetical protein EDD86DRAFT_211496 [Gorgonomyces haynaldii]
MFAVLIASVIAQFTPTPTYHFTATALPDISNSPLPPIVVEEPAVAGTVPTQVVLQGTTGSQGTAGTSGSIDTAIGLGALAVVAGAYFAF